MCASNMGVTSIVCHIEIKICSSLSNLFSFQSMLDEVMVVDCFDIEILCSVYQKE